MDLALANMVEDEEEADPVQEEPLFISAGLGEEGAVMGYMRNKPKKYIVDAAMINCANAGHEKVVHALLKGKADVHSDEAATALEKFVKYHEKLEIASMYLKFGLSTRSHVAGSIFEFAADFGKAQGARCVDDLLGHGLYAQSETAYRGLQLAAQAGHEQIVASLLNAKANPHSEAGEVSLRTASLRGQFKVVKTLLGAHADASSKAGNEALNCATHIGNDSLVRLLLFSNSDPSCGLPAAAFRGNVAFVKLLLSKQADQNSRQKAIKEAARFGHQEVMEALLRGGVDVASPAGQPAGDSALRLSLCSSKEPMVKTAIHQTLTDFGARRLMKLPALMGGSASAPVLKNTARSWGAGSFNKTPPSSRSAASRKLAASKAVNLNCEKRQSCFH